VGLSRSIGIDFCLDQVVGTLSVKPDSRVLNHDLLEGHFGELLSELNWLQGERVVQGHLILRESVLVLVRVV